MSKQWGMVSTAGRWLLSVIFYAELRFQMDFGKAVYLRQSGGKYCVFECPVCHEDRALFKMTANPGGVITAARISRTFLLSTS